MRERSPNLLQVDRPDTLLSFLVLESHLKDPIDLLHVVLLLLFAHLQEKEGGRTRKWRVPVRFEVGRERGNEHVSHDLGGA